MTQPRDFFQQLIQTPSPTGFEEKIQSVVRDTMTPYADSITTDVHGNVIAVKNPRDCAGGTRSCAGGTKSCAGGTKSCAGGTKSCAGGARSCAGGSDAPLRVMLAGHCDQIGLLVNYIDAEGFLYVLPLGGWDAPMLLGQRVIVWSESGPIPGVIGKKPIHLLTDDEKTKVVKVQDLWIDIGAKNKEEAEKLVEIGTPVTMELEYRVLQNDRVAAPGTDDKAGVWVVMEALRRADASKLKCAVYAVSTVQEEVGLRGAKTSAYGIDPQVGIAVDVTFATDCPTIEKKQNGEVALGGGPVIARGPNMNNKLAASLVKTAKDYEIAYQICAEGRITGTDANSIQVNRSGVATGLVSIPNRYMHSPVEVVSLKDIDAAADLLARFLESLEPDASFIPGL